MTEDLCSTCVNSIRCDTWAEWKCKKFERRIYDYYTMTNCEFYEKRKKNFKESKCQCKDCLSNESLYDETERSKNK